MSKGFPSMTAFLGMIALAGYQNKDKIGEFLGGLGKNAPAGPAGQSGQSGLGGLLAGLGGTSAGGMLSGGLGELLERFNQTGHKDIANSWVGTGPNKEISARQLDQAIGPDVLTALTEKTGLSREDLLARLSRELPAAVDKYTPQGRLPAEAA
jgi:uncharacterized protein YidB (DUF937 family)